MSTNQLQLDIDGMGCDSSVAHVRSALARIPGVRVDDVQVGRAVVTLLPATGEAAFRHAVAIAGYTLSDVRVRSANPSLGRGSPEPTETIGSCWGRELQYSSFPLRRAPPVK